MKKVASALMCLVLLTPSANAVSLTKKQRWLMRIAGAGLVGVGFFARTQESSYSSKADDTMNNFNATHTNKQASSYINDQFNAVAQQSAYQQNASAWNIGKNASWGTAGLLFTMSIIPNTWTRPTENGDGAVVGYQWKMGLPHRKK
jgi:hypothetical protein